MSCSGHFWQTTILPGLLMMGLSGCSGLPKMPSPLSFHRAKAPQVTPLAAAQQQERDGHLELARQAYTDLVTADPANAVAWHRLGVVFTRLGDTTSAAHSYNAALSLHPHDAELLTDAGYSCLLRGEHAAAEQLLVTALQKDPQSPRAHQNLALTLGLAGRMDESLATFEKVHPRPQALTNLAYVYQLRGDWPRALTCYETAHQQDARIEIPATLLAKASPPASVNPPLVQTASASSAVVKTASIPVIQPVAHVAQPPLTPAAGAEPAPRLDRSTEAPAWQPLSPPPALLLPADHEPAKASSTLSSSRSIIDEPRVLKARSTATRRSPDTISQPVPVNPSLPVAPVKSPARAPETTQLFPSSDSQPLAAAEPPQTNVIRSQSPAKAVSHDTASPQPLAVAKILASGRSGPPSRSQVDTSPESMLQTPPFVTMTTHTVSITKNGSDTNVPQARVQQTSAPTSSLPPLPSLPTVQPGWKLENNRETFGMVIRSLQNDRPILPPRRLPSDATSGAVPESAIPSEPAAPATTSNSHPAGTIVPVSHSAPANPSEATEVNPIDALVFHEEASSAAIEESRAGRDELTPRNACLVTLRNDRQLVAGQAALNEPHHEQMYSFTSPQAADEFRSAPERFVPAAGGLDIVGVHAGTSVREGQFKNAAWYRERLYLFSTPENETQFRQQPTTFANTSPQP